MSTKRWTVSTIVEEFVKNPKAKILITDADMNNWLNNTDNIITIAPNAYNVFFEKKGGGMWEGYLKSAEPFKGSNKLR